MVEIISVLIPAVSSIITAVISRKINKKVETIKELKDEFAKEIQEIKKQNKEEMDKHILEADKTFLVNFLSDIEQGVQKTEIQKMRAHEVYEEYKSKNGNSYVHDKWVDMVNQGKI